MNAQEAIRRIKEHNKVHRLKERNAIFITVALDVAVEALEKQIPKKPIGDGWGGFLKLCPNCKSKEIYDHKNLEPRKHCDNCGQALDWSSKNDRT